jgi:hypothetical protein
MAERTYELTMSQVVALANSGGDPRNQTELLREVFGPCGSTWNSLRCKLYDGHKGTHSSEYNGLAWAAWETKAEHNDGPAALSEDGA